MRDSSSVRRYSLLTRWAFTLAVLSAIGGTAYVVATLRLPRKRGEVLAPRIREPSGTVFHPGRKTLFVVGDNGDVAEMSIGGRVLQRAFFAGADFESVTVNSATGLLYLLIEGENTILELAPQGLGVLRRFRIDGRFGGETLIPPGAQGLEGIAFLPDPQHPHSGRFFIVNRGPVSKDHRPQAGCSFIAELALPLKSPAATENMATIVSAAGCDADDLSDLTWDRRSKTLVAISDRANTCFSISPDGAVRDIRLLPGRTQEGIAFDDSGFMYVAQDSGGVLKSPPKE